MEIRSAWKYQKKTTHTPVQLIIIWRLVNRHSVYNLHDWRKMMMNDDEWWIQWSRNWGSLSLSSKSWLVLWLQWTMIKVFLLTQTLYVVFPWFWNIYVHLLTNLLWNFLCFPWSEMHRTVTLSILFVHTAATIVVLYWIITDSRQLLRGLRQLLCRRHCHCKHPHIHKYNE